MKKEVFKFYDKDFKKVKYNSRTLYYNVSFFQRSNKLDKDQYVVHVILAAPFKSDGIKAIVAAEELAFKEFLQTHKDIDKSQCVFYLLMEYSKGMRMIPDIAMYEDMVNGMKRIEDEYKVTLGQNLILMPDNLDKSHRFVNTALGSILRPFKKSKDFDVVTNYDAALRSIEGFTKVHVNLDLFKV